MSRGLGLVCLLAAGCTFGSDTGGAGSAGASGGSTGTSVGDPDASTTVAVTDEGSGTGTSSDPDATGTDSGSTGPGVNPTEGTTTDAPPGTSTGDSTSTSTSTSESTGPDEEGSSSTSVAMCATDPWFSPSWSARRQLDINNAGFDQSLSGFPALLRLTPANIDYDVMASDGSDLRIVADDHMTELSYEIEQWQDGGDSFVWVRLPAVPDEGSTPASLFLYYGNDGVAAGETPTAVWDEDFVSVHHFADFSDATGDGHDGMGASLPGIVAGPLGPSGSFDGMSQRVELAMDVEDDYDFISNFTVSAMLRVDSFTIGWQAMVTKGDDTWRMHRSGGSSTAGFGTDNLGGNHNTAGSTPIDNGDWYHVTIIMDGFTKRIFVNAALDAQEFEPATLLSDAPVWFGDNEEQPGRFFHGGMDEIRISSVSRSDTWIDAESRNMVDGTLIGFGAEELCDP